MPLASLPTKTDGSIGRVKADIGVAPDLDHYVPAAEFERIKTFVIDVCDEVGIHAGAAGSLNTRVTTLEGTAASALQQVYENGNTIDVTAAEGAVALSNGTDDTDLLTLTRTFAGGGRGLFVSMGAGATGPAMEALIRDGGGLLIDAQHIGSGTYGLSVQDSANDDNVDVSTVGIEGYGTNIEFVVSTRNVTSVGVGARELQVRGGAGGTGSAVVAGGAGAPISITAGAGGSDLGAGGGAGGALTLRAGNSSGATAGGNALLDAGTSSAGTAGTVDLGGNASSVRVLGGATAMVTVDNASSTVSIQGKITTQTGPGAVNFNNANPLTASSGNQALVTVGGTINQGGTAGWTAFYVNVDDALVGSGNHFVFDCTTTSGGDVFRVDASGVVEGLARFGFTDDPDTYLDHSAADQLDIFVGGGVRTRWSTTQITTYLPVVPDTTNTHDLGTDALRYRALYLSDRLVLPADGSAADVGIGNQTDLTTGIYFTSSGGAIGLGVSGAQKLFVAPLSIQFSVDLDPSGDDTIDIGNASARVRTAYYGPGAASTPSVAVGSTNVGLFESTGNTLGFGVGGSERGRVTSTGFESTNRFGWFADPDTYFQRIAVDQVDIVTGGGLQMRWANGLNTTYADFAPDTNDAYDLGSAALKFRRGYLSQGVIAAKTVASANANIALTDRVILLSVAGSYTLTLPAGAPEGWHIWLKDISGARAANPVTLARSGVESIEGVAGNYSLDVDFGKWLFYFDGTDWWLIGA